MIRPGFKGDASNPQPPFSVSVVGVYPPPYGGVSVHVKRLHRRLNDSGIPCRVYCHPRWPGAKVDGVAPRRASKRLEWEAWLLDSGLWDPADIVHCHDGWNWAPAMWAMVLRGRRVVMTMHDQQTRHKLNQTRGFYRLAARRLFRSPRVSWIAVSSEVKQQLLHLGADAERIHVIPAYLAPPVADAAAVMPASAQEFVRSHAPVLSTYGWHLCFDTQGRDLYGFDLCIELVRQLRADHPRVGLLACLPQIDLPDYYAELQRRIAEHGLEDNVLFVTEPLNDAYLLWQASDVYVRATSTDGDAVAIREAMSLGVPVVASDASPRPPGAVLFRNRDLDGLVGAVRRVLGDKQQFVDALPKADSSDFFRDILDVYRITLFR